MDEAYLTDRIEKVVVDLERLTGTVRAMGAANIRRYPKNYSTLSSDAARCSEQITCRLRHLVYETSEIRKSDYLLSAADAQGIDIQQADDVLKITLPGLVPKRRRRQNPEYLLEPFTTALSRYVENHELPSYEHCVICFAHVYDKKLPERRVRDYDNLELKQLLDVATSFLLPDDGGLLCDAYHTTELGERDCTLMFIMDSRRFPKWLSEREPFITGIKDFNA